MLDQRSLGFTLFERLCGTVLPIAACASRCSRGIAILVIWILVFIGTLAPATAIGLLLAVFSAPKILRWAIVVGLALAIGLTNSIGQKSDPRLAFIFFAVPVAASMSVGLWLGELLKRPRSEFRFEATYLLKEIVLFTFLGSLVLAVPPRVTTWFPFTFPFAHPEQDACEFGPVTNAQYLTMLTKARSMQRWAWLPTDYKAVSSELKRQIVIVAENSSSAHVKIAASHAVFRALGAVYRNNNSVNRLTPDRIKLTDPWSWSYSLAVPRLGVWSFLFLPMNAWLPGGINGADLAPTFRQGGLRASLNFPNPLDPIPQDVFWQSPDVCPPVPSAERAAYLEGPP